MNNKKTLNIDRRNKSEKRFVFFGKVAICFSIAFLIILFSLIFFQGHQAFWRTKIAITPSFDSSSQIDYRQIIKDSLKSYADSQNSIEEINSLYLLVSKMSNIDLKEAINKNPKQSLYWISASSKVDIYIKYGQNHDLNPFQLKIIDELKRKNHIKTFFNWDFFKYGDSREPEIAGILASLVGSLFSMLIFLLCAFPIGIMCAFYLEEFAGKNRFTDIIEISINNLAGIPSIIYGLLGLTLYIQFMHLPRSSTLVGGLTLFMLVLPIITIATRNTIRSIPSSIRDAALAMGASKIQLIWHHLLPLSIPGIMTGTILAISRALGETAPLLMIGMVAFIVDTPTSFSDPASALAVQIYLWSDLPEIGFVEKTAGAIIVLLTLLILLNLTAIILRKKFERKW